MKLKSKSSIHIKKPEIENPEVKIRRQELEHLYQKQGELEILQEKVNRSKPILQTIYSKIKRKEAHYQQQVKNLQSKIKHNSHALRDYKELYEQALRVMHRNNVVDKYKGSSQYLPTQYQPSKFDWKTINKENSNQYRNSKIEAIKKAYSKDKIITKEQIYKIYKQRLGENTEQSQLLDQSVRTNKLRSKQMIIQFENDLAKLKLLRKRKDDQEGENQYRLKLNYLKKQKEKLKEI